jgi:pyruvate,water dikinase
VWLLEIREIADAVRVVESGGRPPSLSSLVSARRSARDQHAGASPPAVITNDGEVIALPIGREVPAGTLVGTAVSGGVYEGIARVLDDPATERLNDGEVLVARFTDPGWTPLFGHAGALVMEVGGQMTHGSVIARELGLPAVVAVEGATRRLHTGDRVRVDGERGWVTVIAAGAA